MLNDIQKRKFLLPELKEIVDLQINDEYMLEGKEVEKVIHCDSHYLNGELLILFIDGTWVMFKSDYDKEEGTFVDIVSYYELKIEGFIEVLYNYHLIDVKLYNLQKEVWNFEERKDIEEAEKRHYRLLKAKYEKK